MSITDELREWMGVVLTDDDPAHAIADRIDAELAERYIELPVDADGVPIHVGDVMVTHHLADGYTTKPWTVWYITNFAGKVEVHDTNGAWRCHGDAHHHRPPTVEDVLDEFVARWMDTHHDDLPALKAEYAKRLRLAGDEE